MNRPCRAYTLIELLVVVVILVTLVAITLPLAKKVLDDSYTREASRQLNGWLAMAKINAVRTGRPWGLYMECEPPVGLTRAGTTLRQVTKVYLAEVQPPYAGSTLGARAEIYKPNPNSNQRELVPVILVGNASQIDTNGELRFWYALVEEGETILVRFDYKGEWYRCQRGDSTNPTPPAFSDPTKFYYVGTLNGLGYPIPPGFNDPMVAYATARPYQILRSPRRVGNPLELTGGTCVDLAYCGIGPVSNGVNATGNGFPPDGGVATPADVFALQVMFTAGGGVEGIYVNTLPCSPQGSVHFLIGKVEKVNPPLGPNADHATNTNMFDSAKSNLADPTSLWVSISRSTGVVTTSDNMPPPIDAASLSASNVTVFPMEAAPPAGRQQSLNPTNATHRGIYIEHCREMALGREQMGGL
jgi:prepilin-type N-terminal cleavage/methylation domain-containing protein